MPFHRGVLRAAPAVLVAIVFALAAAPRAAAHAVLESTQPANDAVVQTSPARVVLHFDEPVETAFGSIRVFDKNGERVDGGDISHPAGGTVALTIGRTLGRGTYTVAWSVISADTHPVHGAFVFSVGSASANPEGVAAKVLREQRTPATVSVGFWIVRFASLVLLLLAGGGAVAAAFLPQADRRVDVVLAVGGALLALVSAAGLVFEGAEAGGYSLGRALSGDVISTVLDSRFGVVWLLRACVATTLAAVSLVLWRRAIRPLVLLRAVLGVTLLVTASLAGHAAATGGFTLAADIAHVFAAGVWAGGLAFVALALALARGGRWKLAARTVPRFSVLAVGAVALLLLTGIVGGYLEVRSWHGLVSTTYGRLVLVKAALLVPLIALGAYNNRRSVPRLRAEVASAPERRRFVRAIGTELVLIVAVLGVTAALVAKPPPKAAAAVARTGPYSSTSEVGPYELNLVVDPARVGHNAIHIYLLKASGLPAAATAVTLAASLEQPQLGPIRIDAEPAGPGHFAAYAHLPIAGDWQLRIEVRRGKFDQWTSTQTIRIGGS